MFKLSLIAVIHLLAVVVHFISELLAAIYAHFQVPHQHFCVLYGTAAVATLLLLIVALTEERRKVKDQSSQLPE